MVELKLTSTVLRSGCSCQSVRACFKLLCISGRIGHIFNKFEKSYCYSKLSVHSTEEILTRQNAVLIVLISPQDSQKKTINIRLTSGGQQGLQGH